MKKLIQKCLIVTLLTLSANHVNAQWAVFDASNFAQTAKLAESTAQQTKFLSDSYKEIKKANDILTKISSQMSNAQIISEIVQDQVNLVGRATNTLQNMRKHKYSNSKMINEFQRNIDDIMVLNKANIDFLRTFMQDGLSMSDGERLQLALEIRKETKIRESELRAIDSRAKSAFDTLKLYKSLSNN